MGNYEWGPQGDPADPDSDAWIEDRLRLERQLKAIDSEESARAWDRQDREANQPGCGHVALVLSGTGLCSLASIYLIYKPQIDQIIQAASDQLSR